MQESLWEQHDVGGEIDVHIDPHTERIEHGHALGKPAGVDAIAQRQLQPSATAQVPGSGDTRTYHGLGPLFHMRPLTQIGLFGRLSVVWIQLHVHVGVGEPGQRGCTLTGDDGGAGWRIRGRADVGNAPIHQHDAVCVQVLLAVPDVEMCERGGLHG